MIRRLSAALATLACCATLPALAADAPSNSYLDVSYLNSVVEFDFGQTEPPDDEVEGFKVVTSVGLAPFVNFVGSYDQRGYRDGRDDFASAGIGGHSGQTLGRNFQAFGAATYEYFGVDRQPFPDYVEGSEDGWGVTLGARYALPSFELHASAKYFALSDYFDFGLSGTTYEVGAALQLTRWWSQTYTVRQRTLELEPETGDIAEITQAEWTVGFRRYFATAGDKLNRKGGIFTSAGGG